MNLNELTALEAVEAIRSGNTSSEQLVRACLDHIAEIEEHIGAWTFLDPDHAIAQAIEADLVLQKGEPLGPLHGIPVGIKDIFDT